MELGESVGLIGGEFRRGDLGVPGEVLLGEVGGVTIVFDSLLGLTCALGKVAGSARMLDVEPTELIENLDEGKVVIGEEVTMLEEGGVVENVAVRKGVKGEFPEGLFGGEDGGDFIGDFSEFILGLLSETRLICEGLLY